MKIRKVGGDTLKQQKRTRDYSLRLQARKWPFVEPLPDFDLWELRRCSRVSGPEASL